MKNWLPLFFVVLFFPINLMAQVDTAFWFAVPKLTSQHQHVPIKLVISTLDQAARVTVKKAYSGTQVGNVLNVQPNSSSTLTLVQDANGLGAFECPHNAICDNGLYISSTANINVYVAVQRNNSEIYALKGQNGLGTKFFVTTQYQFDNGNGFGDGVYSLARNSVEIIATENNTSVEITPSYACGTHPANTPFTVVLQRGQVYTLASNSQLGNNHLCGTIITSDKPIAVDVSDDSVTPHCSLTINDGCGSADLVADQLVPEEMAGSQYIVVPSTASMENTELTSSGVNHYLDYAFIFALEDNSMVSVYSGGTANPMVTTFMMDRGDKQKYHFINNSPIYIYATNSNTGEGAPIFVFQITGAGKEFGGTQLPHIHCTGSTAVGYQPLASANNPPDDKSLFLTLLCDTSYTSGFQINGDGNVLSANDWFPVPGAPEFKYCRKDITDNFVHSSTNIDPFRVTNSLGKFHMGVFDINGSYMDCSISYFSNYEKGSSISWNTDVTLSDYCQGDTIAFDFDSVDVTIQSISGPDGFLLTEEPFFRADVLPANTGFYSVIAEDSRGCQSDPLYDTIEITIHPRVEEMVYASICPGEEYTGYGMNISSNRTVIPGTIYDTIVYQTETYGCDSLLILSLNIRDSVFGEFTHIACEQFTWNGRTYVDPGDYIQVLTDENGCDSIVTLHLDIENPTAKIISSGEDFCEEGTVVLSVVGDAQEYNWSTGDVTSSITATEPGLYTVTVKQGDCLTTDQYAIPTCAFDVYLPNTITPSKMDNVNDCLFLSEYTQSFLSEFNIEIYNRWGELIYTSNDKNFRWDGKEANKGQVYIWIIRAKDLNGKASLHKGSVLVL